MMTGLKMDLASFARHLDPESEHAQRIQSMDELVDEAISTIRRISSELRPGLLDDLGLTAAMEWLADEFNRRSELSCSLSLPQDEPELDPNLKTALFRIFQESLTNVARHAGATRITASLTLEDHELCMQVEDNGRGITREELHGAKSLGLMGMKERAAQWSGTINITGKNGRGTTMLVCIPLPATRKV